MKNFERLKYIISEGNFKYCTVYDSFNNFLLTAEGTTTDILQTKLENFINTWGKNIYNFHFKTAQNTDNSRTSKHQFDFTDNKNTPAPVQNLGHNLNGAFSDAEIEARVIKKVEAILKEQQLNAREQEILRKENDLNQGGKRVGMIIEQHIIPSLLNGFASKNIPAATPILQSSAASLNGLNGWSDPSIKHEIIDVQTVETKENETNKEPTAEQLKYQDAIALLVKNVTADDLLLFAQKVNEKPEIIQQLKNFL